VTFLRTFWWELAQWIAIVGLVLAVAFVWTVVKFLKIGMRAMLKTSPVYRYLYNQDDDDA